MKSKSDVQIQLLNELDEICSKNNLHYILVGLNSLNAFRNHTIVNGPRITAVAMTHGDMERFCEIIERKYGQDRYVEGIFNNPNYKGFTFLYGDRHTTDFHVINIDKKIHHGINIAIYPIRNPIQNFKIKILKKENKLRKFLSKRVENDKFWYMKWSISALNALYSLTGGGKRYYNQLKKVTFIDKWEDIQQFNTVRIGNKEISTKFLKGTERRDVDGINACFPTNIEEYFTEVYGKNYAKKEIKPATQRIRDIVDTEYGYDEILPDSWDILNEARSIHEEMIWERKKFQEERDTLDNLWRLARMTNKQVEYINFFDENYDELIRYNIDDPKEFKELFKELRPVIGSLRRYAKFGMTYSINPKADKLIEEVLIKNGEAEFVQQLKEISKKEYFVE